MIEYLRGIVATFILTIKKLIKMEQKQISELAIRRAISTLRNANAKGFLSDELVKEAAEACGSSLATSAESYAEFLREETPRFFRQFLERFLFTRGYHTIDEVIEQLKDYLKKAA